MRSGTIDVDIDAVLDEQRSRRVGGYLELPAPAALIDAAECLWVHAIGPSSTDVRCTSHRILPDTAASLAFMCRRDAAGRAHIPRLTLIGPIRQPRPLHFEDGHEIVAIRLLPEWLPSLLGTHAAEHADAVNDALPLLAGRGRRLLDALAATRCWREAGKLLSRQASAMLRLEAERRTQAARARLSVSVLRQAPQQQPVSWSAAQLGISTRQLHRHVQDSIGLSPKTFSQSLRFNRVLAAADTAAEPDWATLADAAGYTDQAHLVHEFREFSGLTPTAIMRERRLESALYTLGH